MSEHVIAFDERGARLVEARLSCSTRPWSSDAVEVRDAAVRLVEDGSKAGGLKHGLLHWRCFRIYAERFGDGVIALAVHADGRGMLALATGDEQSVVNASAATVAFLDRAATALSVAELAAQMKEGMT